MSLTGAFAPTVYGDLSGYVGGGGSEEGLLSATFSPDFANDRRIYVYYTQGAPSPTVLSRFQVPGDTIDTGNETRILEVPDFASNHNGGRVLFGPDGYLYLSLGDGGGGGDPQESGQNIESLLGKMLRIKVTGEDRYSVPPDNPFVGAGGLDEIWAYGLRNPWRYSFDRATGDLWLGDVGQGSFEEVDLDRARRKLRLGLLRGLRRVRVERLPGRRLSSSPARSTAPAWRGHAQSPAAMSIAAPRCQSLSDSTSMPTTARGSSGRSTPGTHPRSRC